MLVFILFTAVLLPVILNLCGIKLLLVPEELTFNQALPKWNAGHAGIFEARKNLFYDSLSQYYNHVLGYQYLMVSLYLGIRNSVFHVSPYPDKVVFGLNGWFFLGDHYSNVIKETKGLINFSGTELLRIHHNMMQTKEYCCRRKIKFYPAIAPDKSNTYGKYLPITKSKLPTKFDQVISLFRNTGFIVVDMGSENSNYENRQLYPKSDTHWNQLGLFLGYTALMKEIRKDFPDLMLLKLEQFLIDTAYTTMGDLARMVFYPTNDRQIFLRPKDKSHALKQKGELPVPAGYSINPASFESRFTNETGKYKILVIHDSFCGELPQFMKESFRESVFLWTYFDYKLIDKVNPDILVYELAERSLDFLLYDHVVLD